MRFLDLNAVDSANGFQIILAELDKFYRYDQQAEGPLRCEEYFEKSQRLPNDTVNEYEMRERDLRSRLNDLGIIIPDDVSGWIARSRTAISHYQEPTVRSLCGGKLSPGTVFKALK